MVQPKFGQKSLARTYAHQHEMSCICVRIGQVERDRPPAHRRAQTST